MPNRPTPEENAAWMVRWTLSGSPQSLPLAMLATIPPAAFAHREWFLAWVDDRRTTRMLTLTKLPSKHYAVECWSAEDGLVDVMGEATLHSVHIEMLDGLGLAREYIRKKVREDWLRAREEPDSAP